MYNLNLKEAEYFEWQIFSSGDKRGIMLKDTLNDHILTLCEGCNLEQVVSEHNKRIEGNRYLFLDDMRHNTTDVYNYRNPDVTFSYSLYNIPDKWDYVKNYDEFVEYFKTNKMPQIVSFDHDLHPEHYLPREYWECFEKSYHTQVENYKTYKEKTGLDCLQYLLDYCDETNQKYPKIIFHTQNPVGEFFMKKLLMERSKK